MCYFINQHGNDCQPLFAKKENTKNYQPITMLILIYYIIVIKSTIIIFLIQT